MKNFNWSYPETETECLNLLSDGYRPCGGGTFLVKTALNLKGLFPVPSEQFSECTISGDSVTLGSSLSYTECSEFLEQNFPGNLFSKALGSAASTPLRNRITLGGSIYASPKWSDLAGPLALSGADIIFSGDNKSLKYAEYTDSKTDRKSLLIKSVRIGTDNIFGNYFRFTITSFDYPFFTVSTSKKENLKAAVTGLKGGILLFSGTLSKIMDDFQKTAVFNSERDFSGEYLKTRAAVELERLLSGADNE